MDLWIYGSTDLRIYRLAALVHEANALVKSLMSDLEKNGRAQISKSTATMWSQRLTPNCATGTCRSFF